MTTSLDWYVFLDYGPTTLETVKLSCNWCCISHFLTDKYFQHYMTLQLPFHCSLFVWPISKLSGPKNSSWTTIRLVRAQLLCCYQAVMLWSWNFRTRERPPSVVVLWSWSCSGPETPGSKWFERQERQKTRRTIPRYPSAMSGCEGKNVTGGKSCTAIVKQCCRNGVQIALQLKSSLVCAIKSDTRNKTKLNCSHKIELSHKFCHSCNNTQQIRAQHE